jgi:hypothetical protein
MSVCTYTTGGIPATQTKKVGNVLEVAGNGVFDSGFPAAGVAVAIKAGDGLESGALSRIAGA